MATEPVGGGPPVLAEPLGNAFGRAYGDWFRRCSAGDRPVPCAAPHDAEFVNAWLPAPATDLAAWAGAACAPYVAEYLGAPPSDRYRASAEPVAGQQVPTAACQLTSVNGEPWTGSLAAGKTGVQR